MVHIIPLVGAAALFAQTAFAAVVPLRRTHDSGNSYNSNNNNYNGGNNNVYQQSSNQYDSSSNSYNNNNNNYGSNYNQQYQQESNQYNNNMNNNMNMYESSSSSSENQYNNNQYQQYTSTVAEQSMETSTSQEYQQYQSDTSTESAMAEATSTSSYETSSAQYSMPSYGSGSNNWNNYNNCVQQCQAQFGSSNSMSMENQASVPTGAIHTVLVAPSGAGLRYVPFAVNASIGDTIRYVWTTPANHTVTLSSALAICNKSGIAEQRNFVSGVRNASQGMQTFDVTVQTDQPQFFYCSVLQHCQKGMFGIVNPGSNQGGTNTVGTMMSSLMQNNPQLQAAYNYMSANITGTTAENWGMSIPLDGIPESQYEEVAANVLFTQSTFALNQGMLEGNQGASNPDGSPVQIPQGLNVLLSNTAATPSADLPSPSSSVTPTATGSLTPVNAVTGAGFSTRSVSTWLAVVVGLAGWMLL